MSKWENCVFPGWGPIVKKACDEIEARGIKILQVKEKFGGLRIYADSFDDEIVKIIEKAEFDCEKACEFCGSEALPKSVSIKGWIHTVCQAHDTVDKIAQFRKENNC